MPFFTGEIELDTAETEGPRPGRDVGLIAQNGVGIGARMETRSALRARC